MPTKERKVKRERNGVKRASVQRATHGMFRSTKYLLLEVLMLEMTLLLFLFYAIPATPVQVQQDTPDVSLDSVQPVVSAPDPTSYESSVIAVQRELSELIPVGERTETSFTYESASTYAEHMNDMYDNVLDLVVPAGYQEVHLQLVLAYHDFQESAQLIAQTFSDTTMDADTILTQREESATLRERASARIDRIAVDYPWANLQ